MLIQKSHRTSIFNQLACTINKSAAINHCCKSVDFRKCLLRFTSNDLDYLLPNYYQNSVNTKNDYVPAKLGHSGDVIQPPQSKVARLTFSHRFKTHDS